MHACMYARPMARRYSMESRKEASEATRRRLLQAAIETLCDVGADKLSMEMVAERADAATRTLYNHFSSREDLISQALSVLLDEFREIDRGLPERGEPRELLATFVHHAYDVYRRQGRAIATLLEHRDLPAVDQQIEDMRAWRRSYLTKILRPAKDQLRVPLKHAVTSAFVMTSHATWSALGDGSGLSERDVEKTAIDILDRALFET